MSVQNQGVLIVGVGNLLLGDEGLGIHVTRRLEAQDPHLPGNVQVLDAGTALLDVLPQMAECRYVFLIDAIRAGGKPGTVYRADGVDKIVEQIESAATLSLHELGLRQTLQMARWLGLLPERLSLIGAEPGPMEITPELSPPLVLAAARIVSLLLEELKRPAPEKIPGPLGEG